MVTSINNLKSDMLIEVFSHLKEPKDLANLAKVCKLFQQTSQNDQLWKGLFQRDFPHGSLSTGISVKESYHEKCAQFHQNIINGKCPITTLPIPTAWASCLVLNRNRLFVGGGYRGMGGTDNYIKIWEKNINGDFKEVQCIRDNSGPIWGIEFGDGHLFTLSKDDTHSTLKIWENNKDRSFKEVQTLNSSALPGNHICLGYHKERLFIGNKNSIEIFDKDENGLFKKDLDLTSGSQVFTFKNDLIFAGNGNEIDLWKEEDGIFTKIESLKGHTGGLSCLYFKDNTLFSGAWDHTVKIWKKDEKGSFKEVQTLEGHTYTISDLDFREGLLFTSSFDRTLRAWKSTENGFKELAQLLKKGNFSSPGICCHRFFGDDLIVGDEREVKILDLYKKAL